VLVVEFGQHHLARSRGRWWTSPSQAETGAAGKRYAGVTPRSVSQWSRCPVLHLDRYLLTRMQARHVHLANGRRSHRRPIELGKDLARLATPSSATSLASMSSYGRGGTRFLQGLQFLAKSLRQHVGHHADELPDLDEQSVQLDDAGQDPARFCRWTACTSSAAASSLRKRRRTRSSA